MVVGMLDYQGTRCQRTLRARIAPSSGFEVVNVSRLVSLGKGDVGHELLTVSAKAVVTLLAEQMYRGAAQGDLALYYQAQV